MKSIFDQLKDITETKSGELLGDFDTLQNFSPYMINRWLSMYNPTMTHLINETTNQIYKGIENKEQWYKLYLTLIPKQKSKYVKYIKKSKEKTSIENKKEISQLASYYSMSEREIIDLIERGLITKKQLKEIK